MRRELWILTIVGSSKNMKVMIEAKIAIVISAGKKPAVAEIFYTAKEWKLLGIIYSTNLRNGPEIETT